MSKKGLCKGYNSGSQYFSCTLTLFVLTFHDVYIHEGGRKVENLVHLPNPTHLYHVKFFSTGALTPTPSLLFTPPSFQPSPLLLLVYRSIPLSREPVSAQLLYFSQSSDFTSVHVGPSQGKYLRQLNRLIFSYFQLFSV